ncbi:protein of unknown function [Brevefilum fermentans]|uniref:Uncharacterized protein n=1 Tax=Candidatus Brevifilum fermentans TaxID=1986204 RepID=A0A1Y6K635_9CHLR|nr:protein of unknown function [Brevefilum fermentans]
MNTRPKSPHTGDALFGLKENQVIGTAEIETIQL